MQLPAPESLADLIADGAIAQADASALFAATIGEVKQVDFTHGDTSDGPRTEVIIHAGSGRHTFHAIPVATIDAEQWTWLHHDSAPFDIPELSGTHPLSDALIAAARTLHGNAPALLVPGAGTTTAVIVETPPPATPPRLALITGLANLPPDLERRRALLGFAAARGLGVRENGDQISFSDGTTVTLSDGRVTDISGGMTLAESRADAFYHSAEHQYFFQGVLPDARVSLDPAAGTAAVVSPAGQVTAAATVIATMTEHTWRWAWADQQLRHAQASQGAQSLHRFGMDQGIPELFTAELPLHRARELKLHVAAKPVVHRWIHATAPLAQGRWAVLLLDAPQLHLPAPSHSAVSATLNTTPPAGLDIRRAVSAYAEFRGLRVAHTDTEVVVYVEGQPVPVAV